LRPYTHEDAAVKDAAHSEWRRDDGLRISCDPAELDLDTIAGFLASSYWAKGIARDTVARSIEGSLCFALLDAGRQIGFARVITDGATIAFLADVFVLPEHRGRGLSKWLLQCVLAHPRLQGLRRWILLTVDAHGLYGRYGFKSLERPERWMELHDPDVYKGRGGK
jgi:GNAT superfamily N-acetyltransferase